MTTVVAPRARPRLLSWAAATDHKRIALITAGAALAFLLVSGVFALLIRLELAAPGMQLLSKHQYNELFTAHGSDMIFLVVVPLAMALGVYLVPLQVGAAEIAAPRLCLLGFWLYAFGAFSLYAGFLTGRSGAAAGWTAFYPLSDTINTPGTGMDFWIFGVILATAGMALQGGCILATALGLRAPGMTMLRLPVFSWSMVATCLMLLTAFPVLIVTMSLLEADRLGADIFASSGGPAAYQHLFWFFGHPVVYVMFFPFLGAAGEVAAVFARRRFFGYHALVFSLLTFAALSMSVWAHHMFTTGQVQNEYFALTSTALLVPAGIEYFDMLGTMVGGSIVLRVPMLFVIGFVLQFLVGGLTGIFIASPPLDYHAHDSFFVVGHFHYIAFGASLFALFAAVYFWFPKVTGVLLREGLGKIQFVLLVVGTNLTFFPMLVLGYQGMPRRIADYRPEDGFEGLNLLSTIGAFVLALGIAVFVANVVISLRRREPAGDDPWGGHTLEWATSSPPPRFNFASLPPIRSFAPLLDLREEERR